MLPPKVENWPEAAREALDERKKLILEGEPKAKGWSPEYLDRLAEKVTREDWERHA